MVAVINVVAPTQTVAAMTPKIQMIFNLMTLLVTHGFTVNGETVIKRLD